MMNDEARAAHASEPMKATVNYNAKQLAMTFHNIYEKLAPDFGYETRKETRDFDPTTANGRLMIAVCDEILKYHLTRKAHASEPWTANGLEILSGTRRIAWARDVLQAKAIADAHNATLQPRDFFKT